MNTQITTRQVSSYQVWSYLFNAIKPFPGAIFSMFLCVIAFATSASVNPYLLKIILDRVSQGSQSAVFSYLAVPILAYLGICILQTATYRLYNYLVEIQMIPQLRATIANNCLETLLNKSHMFFQDTFSGSLSNKVADLMGCTSDLIRIVIDRFFAHLLTTIIAIITLWYVNIWFALCMLAWNIVCIGVILYSRKQLTHLAGFWAETGSSVTGKIVDILSNILSVRLFSAHTSEKQSFAQTVGNATKAEQELQWSYLWVWLWYGAAIITLQILNFYFLCKGRQEGWITVGDFALVLTINFSFFEYIWWVAFEVVRFTTLYGRIAQALQTILEPAQLEDSKNATQLAVSRGNITFDRVNFHYPETPNLFSNLSVTIQAGQKVGLVGYSGGGKTTFINLILRLYDVTGGHILIDDQDIRDVTQDSLHLAIATIPQDPSLFHRTLMENIRYGKHGATDEEVIEAAKKAGAHKFISSLPQGYSSLVGERGIKLSGGQRQRIAIARAILKNAPILILDEATSQLDSVTEKYIQDSLWESMQGKTTIVIAHRLSTLLNMDRILVFDQGKIMQDGTHNQLLGQDGLYRTLWNAQVGGFLPEELT